MRYRVRFLRPVLYQAGHPKAEQWISELLVTAPDITSAVTHAVRVVQGDVSGMTIDVAPKVALPPPVEAPC